MGEIETGRDGAVMSIAINRPEKKNALTAGMYDALSNAVEQAETDPTVRVILLHAKGDAFTAGILSGTTSENSHIGIPKADEFPVTA